MNVYDFDKTIYRTDSTTDFYFYCLKKQPSIMKHLPHQARYFIPYLFGKSTKTIAKQEFFIFLQSLPDVDKSIELFWKENIGKIKKKYLDIQREDDVIISASPEFIIKPVCDILGIKNVMGSPVNKHTGKYENGINCYGTEKVRRFREVFGDAKIETFYSDSYSDTPIAEIAEKSYIVKGDKLIEWQLKL